MDQPRRALTGRDPAQRYLFWGIAFILSALLSPPRTAASASWDREKAEKSWEQAQVLQSQLVEKEAAPESEYLKCATTYERVFRYDPHYHRSDDAVFGAAGLYLEMHRRFGNDAFREKSEKLYRFLIAEYPASRFCAQAALRIESIESGDAAALAREPGSGGEDFLRQSASLDARATGSSPRPASGGSSSPAGSADNAAARVNSIRYWSNLGLTRISIDLDRDVRFTESRLADPDRILFDLAATSLPAELHNKTINVGDKQIHRIRSAQYRAEVARIVLDLAAGGQCRVIQLQNPARIVAEIYDGRTPSRDGRIPAAHTLPSAEPATKLSAGGHSPPAGGRGGAPLSTESAAPKRNGETEVPRTLLLENVAPKSPGDATPAPPAAAYPQFKPVINSAGFNAALPAAPLPTVKDLGAVALPKPASPTSHGDRTLARVLGLKVARIVIDPGHGGLDRGTVGPNGMMEKDLVLQVARLLRKMLEENLGAEVFLTRDEDVFISLEERTAIANRYQADLFISIHANSSRSKATSGVETYFLDFARTPSEREVAARENAATVHTYSDLEQLVQKIARADKLAESRELAGQVQKNLFSSAKQIFPSTQNRGVRSAPFVVLIGAKMPSVLVEVAFISNPRDEKQLRNESSRQQVAKAIFEGIEGYMKTLGSEVAQSLDNNR